MDAVALVHLAAGALLVLAAWLVPRRIARSRRARLAVMLLDAAPVGVGAGLLVVAAGRPLFAGVIVLALGAAFTLADFTMRETLHEPAVFSEAVELPQVFTHPHLYLPFAGPGLVLGGATGAILLAAALLLVEPPVWRPHPFAALAGVALIAAGAWLLSREPLLGAVAGLLRRHAKPAGEPFEDAAALGPFGMLIVHAAVARAERGARHTALAAPALGRGQADIPAAADGPIVVVQCESFFDARRLSPLIPRELLAGYDDACRSGIFGRLAVPGWGANTMRAEFAVVTGIPESELGYDRFNPYYALARKPIGSHVWRLRRAGYRTICLHPFDRRFFRRDIAIPALGFEQFLGRETLGGSRTPPYYPDPQLADDILGVLDREGPNAFIFAITMGNHGPWQAKGPPLDPGVAALFDPAQIPDGTGLLRYLDGLKRSDEMLQHLLAGLRQRGLPAVLAFYGDHLPSLPRAFAHFGFNEGASDYVVWRAGDPALGPLRRDIAAHQLGSVVLGSGIFDSGVLGGAEATGGALAGDDHGACAAASEPASFPR
jgi:hypothetical protein